MIIFKTLITFIIIACLPIAGLAEVRVNPEKIYNNGAEAFSKGDYAKAIRLFDDAINHGLQEPQLSDVRNKKILMMSCFSEGPAALVWRSFVVAIASDDYPVAYNLMSSMFKAKVSLDKFRLAFPRDKATAYFGRFNPGRVENVDDTSLLLTLCENGRPTGKPLRMLLEAGSWRIVDL